MKPVLENQNQEDEIEENEENTHTKKYTKNGEIKRPTISINQKLKNRHKERMKRKQVEAKAIRRKEGITAETGIIREIPLVAYRPLLVPLCKRSESPSLVHHP